jgi:hypothetical protein
VSRKADKKALALLLPLEAAGAGRFDEKWINLA